MKPNYSTKIVKRTIRFKKNRWHKGAFESDASILHAAHECACRYDATIVRAVIRDEIGWNPSCKIVIRCERGKWLPFVTLFLSVVQDGINSVSYNN